MQRTSSLVLLLGIFFVGGILLLFMLSLRSGGEKVYRGYHLYTEVADARGLEKGAQVLLAGVPVGVVDKITLTEDRNKVRITMSIGRGTEIREDAVASIQLKSLLGSYFVHLTHGSPTAQAAAKDSTLKSAEVMDINEVMRVVGGMGDEAHGLIVSVNKNQQQFFDKINKVIDDNQANVKTVTESLAKSAPKLENFMDSMTTVTQSLSAGTGTLGKLFREDEVYNSVRTATANIADISTQVHSGKGTLGRVIYDDRMSSQVASTISNVSDASRSVKTFMDTNTKDINEVVKALRDATPNLRAAMKNFLEVSEKVNGGKGTLGKLVNDPQLYDEARRAISQIRKTFEEGEDQSVLRTFMGVFFGSMI